MNLCGHATLSASHILYETGLVKAGEKISFSFKSRRSLIRKQDDWITMNFPAYPLEKMEITPEFKRITGIDRGIIRNRFGWTLALMKNENEVEK